MKAAKLKNFEIMNILKNLNSEFGLMKSNDPDKKLPVSVLWNLSKNVKKLQELADLLNEQEQKINNNYFNEEKSEKNDNGDLEIKPEYRDSFITEKNDLYNLENEVELQTININEISNLNFTPADFTAIEFMIEEE